MLILGCLGLSAVLAVSVAFAITQHHVRRAVKTWRSEQVTLDRELSVLREAVQRTIARLRALERRMRTLMERQDRAEMRAPSTERFKHAIALAQRGATTDELMSTCGLAQGEAELLYLLHRSDAGCRVDHSM